MVKTNFKTQKRILKRNFERLITYSNILSQYNNDIYSSFIRIHDVFKPIINDFQFQSSNCFAELLKDNHSAPGIPGSQVERFSLILNFTDNLIYAFQMYSKTIDQEIIHHIKEINENQSVLIKEEANKVHELSIKRKEFYVQYQIDQNRIEEFHNKINQMYESLDQKDEEQMKNFKVELNKYMKMVKTQKLANRQMNTYNQEYVEGIKSSCNKIRVHLIQNESNLKSMIFLIYPYLSKLNYLMEQFKDNFKDKNWEADFSSFILYHKICRLPCRRIQFHPFEFSFVDSVLKPPILMTRTFNANLPLFIGIAKFDVKPESDYELDLVKGERIYLYEKPCINWVLAKRPGDDKYKFVPGNAIELPKHEQKITILPQIARNDDEMSVESGKLLLVHEEKKDDSGYILCEDIYGNKNYLNAECLSY